MDAFTGTIKLQGLVCSALVAPKGAGNCRSREFKLENMNEPTRISHSKEHLFHTDVPGFDALAELALDMRSSWGHAADHVWQRLDSALWALTHNPWVVLQTVSKEKLQQVLADSDFRRHIDDLVKDRREAAQAPAWFQQTCVKAPLSCVAYFSMEFMLSEALPIYSGGLGNVAGDQLKAASDLGIPLVGVGLLYQQGYFCQVIDQAGMQQEFYPFNDPGQLPITPLRKSNGEWLRLEVELPGHSVWLRAWQVQVGRVKLFLLDSNDSANYPADRGIASELYGGGSELRLKQEILLGIGGWRLLVALGIKPEVCHLNEGHSAFAVLERTRGFMLDAGQSFEVSLSTTRAGNVFTTHTAVAAGFDHFAPALIEQYLGVYARTQLGISTHDLLALGRENPSDDQEPFNTAYLAIRGSGAVNGVSRLHGKVSRQLFAPIFPRWPQVEVPVGHVTNGIHVPTWDSEAADELWTQACGKSRWLGAIDALEQNIRDISDARLWQFRSAARQSLVGYARERWSRQLAASGAPSDVVERAKHLFDCNTLTLGFARRFAGYKRPNLLLHDPDRLLRLLSDPQRPVQLILAGKAHPADRTGQALIQQWTLFIERSAAHARVAFLSDHDMHLTEQLVQGVDVWLNTPRRPWEACGTSGMKVLVNGGINLSELDGWWAEAFTPALGWALGDGREHEDDAASDAADAECLYDLLEREVIPEFYRRDEQGIPRAWVARMRESMAQLTPRFSTNRSVCEYTLQHYLPAACAHAGRAADNGAVGVRIANWRRSLAQHWAALRFGEMQIRSDDKQHFFEVPVYFGDLDPDAVQVELYANGFETAEPERVTMTRAWQLVGASNGYCYQAGVSAARPVSHYTARLMPYLQGVAVPLEAMQILWQR